MPNGRGFRLCPWLVGALLVVGALAIVTPGYAADGVAGWERDGEYQGYYEGGLYDEIKGKVQEIIEVEPLPGMAPGVGLIVEDRDGKRVTVHLGPKRFVDVSVIGLAPGDEIKVMGVHTTIGDKQVFIANKVKKGEYYQVKFRRSDDGTPFWAMKMKELSRFTAEFDPETNKEKPFAERESDWGATSGTRE